MQKTKKHHCTDSVTESQWHPLPWSRNLSCVLCTALTKKNDWNPFWFGLVILNLVSPNIVDICSFLTSIAEGHLASYYHKMGLLRLGLVSENRITKNTTNYTTFSQTLFYILRIKVLLQKKVCVRADLWFWQSLYIYKAACVWICLSVCPSGHLDPGTNSEIEGLTLANSGTNNRNEWD